MAPSWALAENHDDIAVDAAFDRRVAADDHDLTDGLSSLEREVLEHSQGRVRKVEAGEFRFLRVDGDAASQEGKSEKQACFHRCSALSRST